MKVFVKIVFSLVLVAGLSFGLNHFLQKSLFRVEQVEIVLDQTSNQVVLFERIKAELEKKVLPLKGQGLWSVNLAGLLAEVESDKRVQRVEISRRLPNQVRVVLRPHRPVLSLLDRKGKLYPVARDSNLLPAVSVAESLDLPILRGPLFLKNNELRSKAVQLINEIPEKGHLSHETISEVRFDKQEGFILTLDHTGEVVKMGHDQFAFRAGLVERVLKYLSSQQLSGRVIDARFSKKVVVRLRNET